MRRSWMRSLAGRQILVGLSRSSSLALASGLITLDDLKQGRIGHALPVSIPNVSASAHTLPASRSDRRSTDPLSLPESAHLPLDPGVKLTALHLPPLTLMIAGPAHRYEIIVRDGSLEVLSTGRTQPHGTNPYAGSNGYFDGQRLDQLLAPSPGATCSSSR